MFTPPDVGPHLKRLLPVVAVLTGFFLLAWNLPPIAMLQGQDIMALWVHTTVEVFAIVVCGAIFAITWNAYSEEQPIPLQILACGLLAVGLIDLGHTLSYAGMGDFVTPAGPEKAINFWLWARLIFALTLLVVSFQVWQPPTPPRPWLRYWLLAGFLGITALVFWLVLYHPDIWPRTFIEGEGLTTFKIGAEYVIIALLLVPLVMFLRRALSDHGDVTAAFLAAAAAVSILSELAFTLYSHVNDIFNLLGHIYKIVVFILVYQAVFVVNVREPFRRLQQAHLAVQQTRDQLYHAQRMESVGRLAGGVAHDFNNMLSVIIGHAQLGLLEAKPGQSFHENFQQILQAGQRSAQITRQLLAFARKQVISPQVLNLNETIDGMLKMLRRLIGEDIELVWRPAADLGLLKSDPAQLDQILANLCVNARDAISGGGKIVIETANVTVDEAYSAQHQGSTPGNYVTLAVSDNGCGMDKETLAQIYEPFFTTKEVNQGTGLGLPTVYGIVQQNHGFISAYSEPGMGTTFKIFFPRHQEAELAVEEGCGPQAPAGRGETVLLVEDEPAILNLVKALLEHLGYRVLAADKPSLALELAAREEGEIALLITDVIMPELNGRELAQRLQAKRPRLKVLFMSGYTADIIDRHGVLEPGVRFLQKPFTREDLACKVREVLSGQG